MGKQMIPPVLAAVLGLCLAGCGPAPVDEPAAVPAQPAVPVQEPASEPPLDEQDLSVPVPAFLDEEQQLLYRRAYSVYRNLFGGDTSRVDAWPLEPDREGTVRPGGSFIADEHTYTISGGRYADWESFDGMIHGIFTDRWFQEKNTLASGAPVFRAFNGKLGYLDLGTGTGYNRNTNFPDTFELLEQTEELIRFDLVGYYSYCYPLEEEPYVEGQGYPDRDARLKAGYEYTDKWEIRMVRTEAGWRFDSFANTGCDELDYHGIYGEENPSGTEPPSPWEAALARCTVEGIGIGTPFLELPEELLERLEPEGEPYDGWEEEPGKEIAQRYVAPGIEIVTSRLEPSRLEEVLKEQSGEYLLEVFGSEDWRTVYSQELDREYVDRIRLTGPEYQMVSGLKVGDGIGWAGELGYENIKDGQWDGTAGVAGGAVIRFEEGVVTEIRAYDMLNRRVGAFFDP